MKKIFSLSIKRIAVLALIALFFIVILDLNNRLTEFNQLAEKRNSLATEVNGLQATSSALDTQIAYSKSDVAVEDWAYPQGHMVRNGEKLVVPISPNNVTPMPLVTPPPAQTPINNWEVWWALFLGK